MINLDVLKNFDNRKVICIGEVMLDHFIYGEIERISPEAPVQVLSAQRDFYTLGGAGNVVRNLANLGLEVFFLSIIGDDRNGNLVTKELEKLANVKFCLIQDSTRKTITKTRFIAKGQHVLRVDEETTNPCSPEILNQAWEKLSEWLPWAEQIIISDYNKGFLQKDFCQQIIKSNHQVLVDPKGTDYSRYYGATIVKPNLKELSVYVGKNLKNSPQHIINESAEQLLKEQNLQIVVVTQGEAGMTCVTKNHVQHFVTKTKEVFDVSGAGDTVLATLSAATVSGMNINDACYLANIAGSVAVGKTGTAVVSRQELMDSINSSENFNNNVKKIVSLEEANTIVQNWRRNGLKVAFTNGCFDILHFGHLHLLQKSSELADKLIVAVNSDQSIKKIKGDNRPIQDELTRTSLLQALSMIDLVIVFNEETPLKLIENLLPDVLIKGSDYNINNVVGANLVLANGGIVKLIDLQLGHSTTNTVAKIQRSA